MAGNEKWPQTTMMCLVLVAALVFIQDSSTVAFSTGALPSRPSRIWMGADAPTPRRPRKQPAAEEMALKIGLNIAPKGSTNKNDVKNGKKNKKKEKKVNEKDSGHAVPFISWGSSMERFFWPSENPKAEAFPSGRRSTTKMTMHRITNKESFPLVHLRGLLSAESLAWALSLTTDGISANSNSVVSDAEEMEQHERFGGRIRTLRRSLVSQLDPKGELLDVILSNLPVELVGGHGGDVDGLRHHHPYEDGSVVYYRKAEGDFYDEHHDSFSPGETPRDRQRAYTILIYIRTPPGPPSIGGTEFTRLTLTDDNANVGCAERRKDGRGLVVKPRAGDALVWPNFDRDGKPYKDSVHRALPVAALPTAHKGARGSGAQAGNAKEDRIGKVVVNLWFEGFTPTDRRQSAETAKL
jgi:hypothetical protein